jgi:hypothetical protein
MRRISRRRRRRRRNWSKNTKDDCKNYYRTTQKDK